MWTVGNTELTPRFHETSGLPVIGPGRRVPVSALAIWHSLRDRQRIISRNHVSEMPVIHSSGSGQEGLATGPLNERFALLATIDPISRSRAMVKSALTISLYLFSLCL
jgi:hypothetical protein